MVDARCGRDAGSGMLAQRRARSRCWRESWHRKPAGVDAVGVVKLARSRRMTQRLVRTAGVAAARPQEDGSSRSWAAAGVTAGAVAAVEVVSRLLVPRWCRLRAQSAKQKHLKSKSAETAARWSEQRRQTRAAATDDGRRRGWRGCGHSGRHARRHRCRHAGRRRRLWTGTAAGMRDGEQRLVTGECGVLVQWRLVKQRMWCRGTAASCRQAAAAKPVD